MTLNLDRAVPDWRYRHVLLILCTFAFFSTIVARLALSPVVPQITAAFDVSNTMIGASLSGMWLTYALSQFPSGILADRFGERRIILVSIGGTTVASLLIALSPAFVLFFASTALLGALAGLHYSVATSLLSKTSDKVGTVVGIHNAGAPAAGVLTPIAAVWIGTRYGWRPAAALGALVAAPAFVLFYVRVHSTTPERPERSLRDSLDLQLMFSLLSRPSIAFTVGIATVQMFLWQGVASFLPAFLVAYRGQSTALAGTIFSLFFVVQGLTQTVVGAISDRFGRDPVTVFCMASGTAGFLALIFLTDRSVLPVAILLVGVGMSSGAAVIPRFFDELSKTERNVGFGLVRTAYMVLASSGSIVVGVLADTYGWGISFGLLAVLSMVIISALGLNWALGLGY